MSALALWLMVINRTVLDCTRCGRPTRRCCNNGGVMRMWVVRGWVVVVGLDPWGVVWVLVVAVVEVVVVLVGQRNYRGTHTIAVRWQCGAVCAMGIWSRRVAVGAGVKARGLLLARAAAAAWQPRISSNKLSIFFLNLKPRTKCQLRIKRIKGKKAIGTEIKIERKNQKKLNVEGLLHSYVHSLDTLIYLIVLYKNQTWHWWCGHFLHKVLHLVQLVLRFRLSLRVRNLQECGGML